MAGKTHKQYPAIKGLTWHRDRYYSFFAPMDWHRFVWPDEQYGEIYGPDPDDPSTVFGVVLQDLGTAPTPDDLDVLAEGFFETIESLPEVTIESRSQEVIGGLLLLETKYTCREGGDIHKRWVRVYYHETRQITMLAQGSTPETYDYWLPMFFESMMTARVHNTKPDIDFLG